MLPPFINRLPALIERRRKTILIAAIAIYVAIFVAACFWKYRMFAYDGIDLAYFSQVFWNSLHGRWFVSSIHPLLSLGDHAELAIPLLLPFYALGGGPRTLLVLQTVVLALSAWPLWRIAEKRLASWPRPFATLVPLGLALAWLASPFVQNINLFEFHVLPFVLLPFFFAVLEYEKGRKVPFLIFIVLALLVREDVALIVVALGVLAWLERRSWFWRLTPILLGGAWFLAAMRLISRFAPAGGYKFLIYYSWLGSTPGEMVMNAARRPLTVLAHIVTLPNLEMILGFGLPLLFLSFFRPRRLILAVGPLLQIFFGAPGGGELILRTHYATLFLPGLFLAAIEGAAVLPALAAKAARRGLPDASHLIGLLLAASVVYCGLILGPLPTVAAKLVRPGELAQRAVESESLMSLIPADASVAASYSLLPALASREKIYSLHYQFLGVSQFGLTPYVLPDDTRFIALDSADLLNYAAQFPATGWAAPHYAGGYGRLRAAVGPVVFSLGTFKLFDKAGQGDVERLSWLAPPSQQDFSGGFFLAGVGTELRPDPELKTTVLRLTTAWTGKSPLPAEDLVMRLRLLRPGGVTVLDQSYPVANGLTPTTEFSGRVAVGELNLPLFGLPPGSYYPELLLEKQDAHMVLDGVGSMQRVIVSREPFGHAVLPAVVLK